MSGSVSKRLEMELNAMRNSSQIIFRSIELVDGNIFEWQGLIATDQPPFNEGFFLINISFPPTYPFAPPTITFSTKIYHPNISETGEVSLQVIDPSNWKPATKPIQIVQYLVTLINHPEVKHSLRADLAEQYVKNKKQFLKDAKAHTVTHAIKRD